MSDHNFEQCGIARTNANLGYIHKLSVPFALSFPPGVAPVITAQREGGPETQVLFPLRLLPILLWWPRPAELNRSGLMSAAKFPGSSQLLAFDTPEAALLAGLVSVIGGVSLQSVSFQTGMMSTEQARPVERPRAMLAPLGLTERHLQLANHLTEADLILRQAAELLQTNGVTLEHLRIAYARNG